MKLTRRALMASGAALTTLALPAAAETQPRRKPNFIIILADDLGYGDVGFNGGQMIKTPHLDKMARQGLTMTQAYASANICTPSRAGLLTGRYPIRTGLGWQVIMSGDKKGLPPSEVTIPEALGPDYRSAFIGKWHLGHVAPYWPPTEQGFNTFFGLPYSHDMKPLALYNAQKGVELTQEDVDFARLTERFFERGLRFVEAQKDQPFFLTLALTAPHIPLDPHPGHAGHSKAAAYGDVVEEVDANVGRLIAKLKTLGIDKDTIVIVTSDNGPWFEGSAGPLRDRKGGAGYDGGYRVPFVIWGPGHIPRGKTSDVMSMNIDIMPSLVALSGGQLPSGVVIDGKDMSAHWQKGRAVPDRELILFDNENVAAIRHGRWKFVGRSYYRSYEIPLTLFGDGLLFDVAADPAEAYNLAGAQPEVLKDMRARFEAAKKTFAPFATKPLSDRVPGR